MILLFLLLSIPVSFTSTSLLEDSAVLSMVPRGKILERIGREIEIKTIGATKVKIELFRDGTLQEASGKNLNRGDVFEPGIGLIALGSAAQKLPATAKNTSYIWNLEKDPSSGWIYEFVSINEDETEYFLVDASNGNLIKN